MSKPRPRPFYDPSEPEANGRWKVIIRQGSLVIHRRFPTQFAANKAVGIKGGSKDSRYRPQGTV